MTNELDQLFETVHDRDSFLAFVAALAADRRTEVKEEKEHPSPPYGPGCRGWENGSIETFLEACVSCADDWGNRPEGLPTEPSWKDFARFLYSGKVYE